MPRPSEVFRPNTGGASEGMLGALVDAVDAQTDFGRKKVEDQDSFVNGSGRLSAALANNLRATLQNPVGSGKNLFIYALTAFCTVQAYGELRINPTTGLPVGLRTASNKRVGGRASFAVMNADLNATTPLGGGSLASTVIAISPGRREEITLDHPFMLAPGITMGVGVPLSAAGDIVLNVSYWEENV